MSHSLLRRPALVRLARNRKGEDDGANDGRDRLVRPELLSRGATWVNGDCVSITLPRSRPCAPSCVAQSTLQT
ncbi:hypothetical protein OPV22_011874 [Ensete ventricosum]|uniref:Uncharacterized protein n=1 Tax=Ensete ventricosum TaxID=4639 RepID=A0AAV8RIW4_ENSVE|nr:hypothetical protein OPV22_011874 [Ensete ventricosum]